MVDVWTYDRFKDNTTIGECTVLPDVHQLALWQKIGGRVHDAIDLPGGLLLALAMRGYLSVVEPRPPGNVHASSVLRWGVTPVHVGDPLLVRVACLSKHIANDRRWVRLLVTLVNGDGAFVLSNELKMVWAA